MFGKQETLVVDLGTFYVKVLRVVPTKTGGKAAGFLVQETGLSSPNPQLNDELRDSYILALTKLLKENGVKTKRAIFAIPGRSIFSRPLKIPPVAGDRLARIIEFEARQHLPFPLEEVRMEHKAFPTDGGEMDVALLAVKRDALSFYIDVLRKCGLSPTAIDVSSLALYNVYGDSTQKQEGDDVVGLVDIGASTSDIVIESGGVLKFMRRARVGGNSLTSMLAQEMGQSFQEAERIKIRSSEEGLPDLNATSRISEILLRGFERIAGDLKNTLDFYVSRPDGLPVNRLYITGGTSRFGSLVTFLEERLGLPVELLKPFQINALDMEAISEEKMQDLSAVCVGLGLKAVGKAAIDLNFTPEYILEQQAMARKRPALALQALLVAGVVGSLMYIANAELGRLRAAEAEIEDIATKAQDVDKRIRDVIDDDKLLRERFNNLQMASGERGKSVRYLLELGKIKPNSVWVKNLSVSQRALSMIVGGDTQGVGDFERKIKISPYFDPMRVSRTQLPGSEYEINIDSPKLPAEETRVVYEELQRENLGQLLYELFYYMPGVTTLGVGLAADQPQYQDVFKRLANASVAAKSSVEGLGTGSTIEFVGVRMYDSFYKPQFEVNIPYEKLEELQKQSIDWAEFNQWLGENKKAMGAS